MNHLTKKLGYSLKSRSSIHTQDFAYGMLGRSHQQQSPSTKMSENLQKTESFYLNRKSENTISMLPEDLQL